MLLLPMIHRHSIIMALALLVFSQSFSPLMKYHQSKRVSYNPSPISSSGGASSPTNVWNIMILFTSKSLSLVEESSSDLPKFDSAFAEAIGKPFKRWTEENIGETKKKLLSKSPLRKATDKPQTTSTEMSKDLTQTTSTVSTDVKKVNEISRVEAKTVEQLKQQVETTEVEEDDEEEEEELKLHPESLKYREEQLNKQWKQIQLKIQTRLQTRSFIQRLTLSKEVKEVEEYILNKPTITEKEYKQLLKKEHNIMKQLLQRKDNNNDKKKPLQELIDLFPEVKSLIPKYAKKEDGGLVLCTSDEDCPFPLTCCPGFRQTGERFCCSGWGERVMTPAYVMNPLLSDQPTGAKDSGYQIKSSQGSCPYR